MTEPITEPCGWCGTPCPVLLAHSTPMCQDCLDSRYPDERLTGTDTARRDERARAYLVAARRRLADQRLQDVQNATPGPVALVAAIVGAAAFGAAWAAWWRGLLI